MPGFKPIHDRVLLRRKEAEEKSPGGIIIPENAKEKPVEAVVVAVGPGRTNDQGELRALQVKKDQRVLIGKYAGTEIKIEGVTHVIVREEEIFGVLE
jgi:chaperonin GroES